MRGYQLLLAGALSDRRTDEFTRWLPCPLQFEICSWLAGIGSEWITVGHLGLQLPQSQGKRQR
jgi:hypothetical protein